MQRLQEEEENSILDDIETNVGRLKHKAVAINREIVDQNRMLDDTTDQVTNTQDKLDITNSRVDKLNAKLAECCGCGSFKLWIVIAGLVFFVVILLLLIIWD